ncbi:MAG: TSUP family transporter, partial [Halobacteriovoraceae bacterium]|nr:TSUP family transporter [Halobacteriovoraceae bacterium]
TFLMMVHKMPFDRIPSYSNPIMSIGCLAGIISFMSASKNSAAVLVGVPEAFKAWQWNHLNFALVALLVVSSLPGSFLGSRLSNKIDRNKAKQAFAILLYVAAINILLS